MYTGAVLAAGTCYHTVITAPLAAVSDRFICCKLIRQTMSAQDKHLAGGAAVRDGQARASLAAGILSQNAANPEGRQLSATEQGRLCTVRWHLRST